MSNPVFRPDLHDGAVAVLEGLLENEPEERVALEAAGSAAALGSRLGEERISAVLWDDRRSDLSMEAILRGCGSSKLDPANLC